MAYTYHISTDNKVSWAEFFPYSKNKVTAETEANEIFKRWKVDEIVIDARRNSAVYSTLASNFFDSTKFGDMVYYVIKRNGTDVFFWKCPVKDGKVDAQNKMFACQPVPDDNYEVIIEKQEVKYDIGFALGSACIAYDISSTAFINVDFSSFSDASRTVNYTNTTGGTTYARMTITPGALGAGDKMVMIVRNTSVVTGSNVQVRVLNNLFATISNVEDVDDGVIELVLTGSSPAYIQLSHDGSMGTGEGDGDGSFDYEMYYYTANTNVANGLMLETFINQMLTVMGTGMTVTSTYLFNDALPAEAPAAIDAYMTANPTHNYVSLAVNNWNDLFVGRVGDLSSKPSSSLIITFKDLMLMLKYKLNAYWYIDSSGAFRIEHQMYFREFPSQIDLTNATYLQYKPEVDRSVYRYDRADNYQVVQYTENNEGTDDFVAFPIIYDLAKTTPKTLDVTVPLCSTDIEWIIDNTADVNPAGLLLVEVDTTTSTSNAMVFVESSTPEFYYQNGHLSWFNLFPIYWQYFAEADEADINDGDTLTATHVKELLEQTAVKFYHNGILNPIYPVTVALGLGWSKKIELDLESGWYTIDVGFDPYSI
jgi:hypothetical protein